MLLTKLWYYGFLAMSPLFCSDLTIVPLNSANFSTSDRMDRMDEMNFWNPKLFVSSGFPFGVLTYGGLRPQKEHLRRVRFPLVPLVCSKTYAGYRKNRLFIWVCRRQKLPEFFGAADCYAHVYWLGTDIVEIRCT